jgi:general stress protein 26
MTALTPRLRGFLDSQIVGVLATDPPQGHPRQSVVYYVRDGDRLLISSVTERRKVADVERTGWASLCVVGKERPSVRDVLMARRGPDRGHRHRDRGCGAALHGQR